MTAVHCLASSWRDRATMFRDHAEDSVAIAYERCAEELEDALHDQDATLYTLQEAAAVSGYTAGHLGRLVRDGRIPNAGRPSAPRIAHRHLPEKSDVASHRESRHLDPTQIVRLAIKQE